MIDALKNRSILIMYAPLLQYDPVYRDREIRLTGTSGYGVSVLPHEIGHPLLGYMYTGGWQDSHPGNYKDPEKRTGWYAWPGYEGGIMQYFEYDPWSTDKEIEDFMSVWGSQLKGKCDEDLCGCPPDCAPAKRVWAIWDKLEGNK